MDYRTEEILNAFPGLRYDMGFKVTSPENPDYNCIAWALGYNDHWLWPDDGVDGVELWPQNGCEDICLNTFIEAFRGQGYDICDDAEYVNGVEKIALYAYPDSQDFTHAARQLANGMWTSKLGNSFDIQHSTPYTIQGRLYGIVICVMGRRR